MYFFPVLVMLHMTCQTSLADGLIVEVDAKCWGAFLTFEHPVNHDGVYVLKEGWIRNGFLEIWWGEETGEAEEVTPGRHFRNPDDCEFHPVTISQSFGVGLRQRQRSWTLIDACPIAWEIKENAADDDKLQFVELTVVASQIGVAR